MFFFLNNSKCLWGLEPVNDFLVFIVCPYNCMLPGTCCKCVSIRQQKTCAYFSCLLQCMEFVKAHLFFKLNHKIVHLWFRGITLFRDIRNGFTCKNCQMHLMDHLCVYAQKLLGVDLMPSWKTPPLYALRAHTFHEGKQAWLFGKYSRTKCVVVSVEIGYG